MPHGTADKGKLPTDVNTMVQKTLAKLLAQEKQLKREVKEINYYMKVHGMQDEGYTAVLAYAHKLKTRLAEVQKVSKRLAVLRKEKQLRVLRHTRYALLFDGKSIATKCLREDQQWGLCLLQTTNERKPWRANALSALPWGMSATGEVRVASVPGLGLDPLAIQQFKDILQARAQAGCAILLTTHVLGLVENLADSYLMMQAGRLYAQGTLADLQEALEAPGASLDQLYIQMASREVTA